MPTQSGTNSLLATWRDEDRVSSLTLSTELRRQDRRVSSAVPSDEGVGVLATYRNGSSLTAVRFYPGRNTDRSPRRYTMDPADVLPALADMKRRRLGSGRSSTHIRIRLRFPLGPTSLRRTLPGVLSSDRGIFTGGRAEGLETRLR